MSVISQLIHLIMYSSHNTLNIYYYTTLQLQIFRIFCIFTIDEGISLDELSLRSIRFT